MNKSKYWTLYYAEKKLAGDVNSLSDIPKFKIITAAGVIECNFCPDIYGEEEKSPTAKKLVAIYNSAASQVDPNAQKENREPIFPFDDSSPMLLRNVSINGTNHLDYMLIFPSEIIGISL